MKKLAILSILLVAILATSMVPAYAFVTPGGGEDGKYELYGPHIKGIQITIYANQENEWTAMNLHPPALDIEDWALTQAWITQWTSDARFQLMGYGGENGFFILDMNNNDTLPDGTANPLSEVQMRQAIAYLVNRQNIVNVITGGLGLPMWTPVPTYMTGVVDWEITPAGYTVPTGWTAGARADLTYGGLTGDINQANVTLNANYPIVGGVRQYHGSPMPTMTFYVRSDDPERNAIGLALQGAFAQVELPVNVLYVPRSTTSAIVMGAKNFAMYTGAWTGIGPDPDWLYDLYDKDMYWNPGKPPNYAYTGLHDPLLNHYLEEIKFNQTIGYNGVLGPKSGGIGAAIDAQVEFATNCAGVPLFCHSGVKAYTKAPVAGGANWQQMVNEPSIGLNNWWTTLDAVSPGSPNTYMQYGFKSDLEMQNIVYYQWYWDAEILGRVYDGGAGRDPISLTTWVPQLFRSWTVGNWTDSSGNVNTAVTFYLRPDVYFSDGVPMTTADVYYTLVEMPKDLIAKGFAPPWWYPTVQDFLSIEVLDPYTMQILLDVNSVWGMGWVIGSAVLPKHIWKPIVDDSINDGVHDYVTKTFADPYEVGTGPFLYHSNSPGVNAVMDANFPGTVETQTYTGVAPHYPIASGTPVTSPGYYLYNPLWVDVSPDNNLPKVNIPATATSVQSNITITLRDLSTSGNLIVDKYVYTSPTLAGLATATPLISRTGITLTPQSTGYPYSIGDSELVQLTLTKASLTYVKVACKVTGQTGIATPSYVNTWVNVTLPIWVTIKEDIGGTDLYSVLGISVPNYMKSEALAPDLSVDLRDVYAAALAFGTAPGDLKWNPACDIVRDFTIDLRDYYAICLKFGW